jgi:hypothetical protein
MILRRCSGVRVSAIGFYFPNSIVVGRSFKYLQLEQLAEVERHVLPHACRKSCLLVVNR